MNQLGVAQARPGSGAVPYPGMHREHTRVERYPPIRWLSFTVLSLAVATLLFVAFPYDIRQSQQESGSVEAQLNEMSGLVEKGRPERRASLLALGVIALLALRRGSENSVRLNRWTSLVAVGFLAWIAASLGWSDDPFLSLKRMIAAFIMCALALALARGFSKEELLLFSVLTLGLAVAIGVISELWLGTFRPLDPDYRFGGELHPNVMAYHCSLLALALLACARTVPRLRWVCWGTALLAVGLLLLTKSRTGLAGFVIATGVVVALSASRRTKLVWLSALGCLISGLLIIEPEFPLWLGRAMSMGRADSDLSTLTGRTSLWRVVWDVGMQRPLTGFGYGAFWSWGHILEIAQTLNWLPTQAHSSVLEVTLNVGIVGLTTYLLLHAGVLAHALKRVRTDRGSVFALFIVAVLINMHMNGLTEIILFRENLGVLIFLIMTALVAFVESPPEPMAPATVRGQDPSRRVRLAGPSLSRLFKQPLR